MNDLRLRILHIVELRRKHAAHVPLSEAELALVQEGIPADEYHEIVEQIRAERRSAAPSKAARTATAKRAAKEPIDLDAFI